jgi:pyruvate,water dikinase
MDTHKPEPPIRASSSGVGAEPGAPRRFTSPFAVPTPPGAEGWEQMFPYYALFRPESRASEEQRCWFFEGMHFPEPLAPFDCVIADSVYLAFGQANTRIFCIPSTLGFDYRIVNGYLYFSPNEVADPEEVHRRVQLFLPRAGHYYRNWEALYARWEQKVTDAIRCLEEVEVPDLPEVEDEAVVMEARGVGSAGALLLAYDRCLEGIHTIWQYHFELLNLGYAAYLSFYTACKDAFPEISDQSVTKMVSGVDTLLFQPDEALKGLARTALELGVQDAFKRGQTPAEIEAELAQSEPGSRWLAKLQASKRPWFNLSYGNGFYHHHRSWIDQPARPFATLGDYIQRLERGEDIARPLEALRRERDRVVAEYRALLTDSDRRQVFDDTLGLARTVFPYVESHNFYVEHWYHTVFWNKIREFGALLVRHEFFAHEDDIFLLHRHEVHIALHDLMLAWATGSKARGSCHWPPIIEKRKAILNVLREWQPLPALGQAPEAISDPLTIMLMGITGDQIDRWLEQAAGDGTVMLRGFAGSPGIVEGRARVIRRADELDAVEEGEILVCPTASPSWAMLFGKLKGAVSDLGGIMCHAAIVAREYGLPAVVGTGFGTSRIETGQRIRVDGDAGVVTILD